jgi:hypothetical protein
MAQQFLGLPAYKGIRLRVDVRHSNPGLKGLYARFVFHASELTNASHKIGGQAV